MGRYNNLDHLLTPDGKRELLFLCRAFLSHELEGKTYFPTPTPLVQGILSLPLGVFVTLKKGPKLRGCIGNFAGNMPLSEILFPVTIDSALHDHRFPPLSSDELHEVQIHLSLLTPDIGITGPADIELGKHGIVLQSRGHRSVFLPEVPVEQGWDLVTTLSALSRKAGLPPDAWKERDTEFRVFTTYHFGEPITSVNPNEKENR